MATIVDVAKAARVSPATVSRVLSGRPLVAPATRARVEAAIRAMHFTPNGLARGLVTKRTDTIGLVLPDIANPFFPALARGAQDIATAEGFNIMLANSDGSVERERSHLRAFQARQVDGIIIVSAGITPKEIFDVAAGGIQVVLVGRAARSLDGHLAEVPKICDWVRIDNWRGAQEVTAHLASLGHRCIAMIGGPGSISTSRERFAGYRAALDAAALPFDPHLVLEGDFRFDGGYHAAERLLDRAGWTALFAANDMMAVGALQAIKAHGLRVPDDISLAGFDDMPFARFVTPALTTVAVSSYAMGEQAMRLLLERVRGGGKGSRQIVMRPRLLIRESTAAARLGNDRKEAAPTTPGDAEAAEPGRSGAGPDRGVDGA